MRGDVCKTTHTQRQSRSLSFVLMREMHAEVAELLGVDVGAIDPTASLISQGLDSIRMMSLAGRWRRRGRDVDFATLSADPTVAAWSQLVSAEACAPVVVESAASVCSGVSKRDALPNEGNVPLLAPTALSRLDLTATFHQGHSAHNIVIFTNKLLSLPADALYLPRFFVTIHDHNS